MTEIIGRPQGRRFGEPFSPLKTPPPPTKPADAQSVANAAYRIYERLTGKGNSEIRSHVHDTYGASVYDWWKVRRFNGNAAEYLAYVSRDAVIWACELAAKKRHIKWQDAVAMAGDAPDTANSEDPKRDIAAWVETLDFIIAQGELTPGAPSETYAAMRAEHLAKLERKYAEQKEKVEVSIKQEKSKQAALDAAKKTAALKAQVEPAVDKLNAAIAELKDEQDFNDTPPEGIDMATGEIIPVEPGPGLDYFGNPVKVDPIETNRTATIAYFAALYNIDPENIETIVRGLNTALGDPWHKEADKLSMAEIEQKLNDFHKANPRNSERAPEPAAKPSEPPAKVDEPQSKPIVENRPVDGAKNGNPETALITFPEIISDFRNALIKVKAANDLVRTMRDQKLLVMGRDYGRINEKNEKEKPSLWKPGAEKLCTAFELVPKFELIGKVETWDADKPLFHYQYRCRLYKSTGEQIAEAVGSCNSREKKYRYRKVYAKGLAELGLKHEDIPANRRVEMQGNNGKYWQYTVENDEVFDLVNTIDKMAQKRALIAAVLIGTNASEYFTQDTEHMLSFGYGDAIDAEIVA